MASQQYKQQAAHIEKNAAEGTTVDAASTKPTLVNRFGSPKSTAQVESVRKLGVPAKTREQNVWASTVWRVWAKYRRSIEPVEEVEQQHVLEEGFSIMTVPAMNFWLCKFVLEVRRKDGEPYGPDTLYQIRCALLRLLKDADRGDVNVLTNHKFTKFRGTLDARMKELKNTGKYQPRKAETISEIHENLLWEKHLLGDSNPQQLINIVVYYTGLLFSLRSGNEHRRLRFRPSQIELFEPPNERAYLRYTEDVSKTNHEGLKTRKRETKVVIHYQNVDNPKRCYIRLYKLYMSVCPRDLPDNAFYLKSLSEPQGECWFTSVPIGHMLQNIVPNLLI